MQGGIYAALRDEVLFAKRPQQLGSDEMALVVRRRAAMSNLIKDDGGPFCSRTNADDELAARLQRFFEEKADAGGTYIAKAGLNGTAGDDIIAEKNSYRPRDRLTRLAAIFCPGWISRRRGPRALLIHR